MFITADTNTFIVVALSEPERDLIIKLTVGHQLIAPEVLPFEIGNALSAMVKKHRLSKNEVIASWEIINQIPVNLKHINIKSALNLAGDYGLYAYDAFFLECAISQRSPMLTLDQGMKKIAGEMGINILE